MAEQTEQKEEQQPGSALEIMKQETVDVVATKVREFQERGEIHFPVNYSPENAMKAAWLAVQNTVDKDKNAALDVCTKRSIANSLLDMVVQGLNPAKKQCYFIVYGKELVCQRSYFGTMSVAKMVDPTIKDIVAQVIYEADEFDYEIDKQGRKRLVKHKQSLANIDKSKIIGAYCTIIWDDHEFMDVMTIDELKQSWKQSKMYPIDGQGNVKADSVHGKFTTDMAMKTVINRACKFYINSSNDSSLVIDHFHHADEAAEAAALEEEIQTNANQEIIDVDPVTGEIGPAQELSPDDENQVQVETEAQEATARPGF